jgi:hypothetical protein
MTVLNFHVIVSEGSMTPRKSFQRGNESWLHQQITERDSMQSVFVSHLLEGLQLRAITISHVNLNLTYYSNVTIMVKAFLKRLPRGNY